MRRKVVFYVTGKFYYVQFRFEKYTLLECTVPTHLRIAHGGFCTAIAESSSCKRHHGAHEAKYIYYLSL